MASNYDIRKECKICHEDYVDPHILQCGHSFCKKCIDGITCCPIPNEHKTIKCPLCNVSSSSSTKNYMISELLEVIEKMQNSDKIRVRSIRQLEVNCHEKGHATSFRGIAEKKWIQQKSIHLANMTNNLRLIDGNLWTCHQGGCTIFTLDLVELSKITFSHVAVYKEGTVDENDRRPYDSNVYDIVREGANSLIVASKHGLLRAFEDGTLQRKISKDTHIDICVSSKRIVYVNESGIKMTTLAGEIFSYSEKLLGTTDNITDRRYGDRILTVSFIGNDLLVCKSNANTIECYSVDCEKQPKYNKLPFNITKEYAYYEHIRYGKKLYRDDFEVDNPFICFSDSDGNVLIADCGSDRLLLRRLTGEYMELDLQPPVIAPHCAVYYDNKLFVVSWHHRKLYRYECTENE